MTENHKSYSVAHSFPPSYDEQIYIDYGRERDNCEILLKKYTDKYLLKFEDYPYKFVYEFYLNNIKHFITYYMNYIHSENNPLKKLFKNKKDDSNIISLKPDKHLLEVEICGKNTKVYLGLEELEDWFIENK